MNTAILHYSAPPVVGGVEAVIHAHANLLLSAGYPVVILTGLGEQVALPKGAEFVHIPEMDSRHPQVIQVGRELESGLVSPAFAALSASLETSLEPLLASMDTVIIHNILTKHFNLPLTNALVSLLNRGKLKYCIAWCHDFSWTSPHSRPSLHDGYPWDLLRTCRQDVTYVTVSNQRKAELVGLFKCSPEEVHVVYNGVDPGDIYSLSADGRKLVSELGLSAADLVLLMPVRITQAKNIEFAMQVVAELKTRGIRPKLVVTGPPDPHDPGDMEYYQGLLNLRQRMQVTEEVRFVYEVDQERDSGRTIDLPLVRELYRACDALFMPSHREGFGMPILEAGLIGMPIFSTAIPAAEEIGGSEIFKFQAEDPAEYVAEMIEIWMKASMSQKLRQRIRQNYTWQAIFTAHILPLLTRGSSS